ncbi:MAG: hypothetical protein ACM3H7_05035, partial [Acidobacteriaceae bacterium]
QGISNTTMLSFGSLLSDNQITELVAAIRQFVPSQPGPGGQPTPAGLTFDKDILPIFNQRCLMCHGTFGGWDGSSYQKAMTTGDHAPVITPGDASDSLLAQKILGTASFGEIMPPGGKLPEATIQIILDWIAAGAAEK